MVNPVQKSSKDATQAINRSNWSLTKSLFTAYHFKMKEDRETATWRSRNTWKAASWAKFEDQQGCTLFCPDMYTTNKTQWIQHHTSFNISSIHIENKSWKDAKSPLKGLPKKEKSEKKRNKAYQECPLINHIHEKIKWIRQKAKETTWWVGIGTKCSTTIFSVTEHLNNGIKL